MLFMQFNSNIVNRFWSKVNKTNSCWNWIASKDNGYGRFWLDGRNLMAHRFSYSLTNGPIFHNEVVCHKCDNPACVRPDHLFLGTRDDNMLDMVSKGRSAKGILNGNKKLTEQQVLEIRNLYVTTNITYAELARRYNVDKTNIPSIIKRETWKHI